MSGDPLAGRRILVTGASSGIGAAIARAVAAGGGRVALLARRSDRLAEVAADLDAAVVVPADVTDVAAVRGAVDTAVAAFGGLDGVVNAAGILRRGPMSQIDPHAVRAMFEVNVIGLLQVTQAVLPALRDGGHSDIVNISSMSGRRIASAPGAMYAATKFAVHAISQGLRLELADTSVRTTTVSPGFVRTDIGAAVTGPGGDDFRTAVHDQGMSPDVVAGLVVTALAAPPGVEVVELAVMPKAQDPR